MLNAAAAILFLTAGIEKAPALAGVVDNTRADYPAALIKPHSGSLTWMADRAAASSLKGSVVLECGDKSPRSIIGK